MPAEPQSPPGTPTLPSLGLAANLTQFSLLVLVNVGVGGLIGAHRSVVPLLGEREFALTSAGAVASFVAAFGIAKCLANLVSGSLAQRYGRRNVLVFGCGLGIPVPLIIILAPSWGWIVAANALLGVNQGLAWSMTVAMKIDLVGPRQRGLAMGLNECAGYGAVGVSAWIASILAGHYHLRPEPFYFTLGIAVAALCVAALLVHDTATHAQVEAAATAPPQTAHRPLGPRITAQAGFVNNLNDGVIWCLLPLLLAARGLDVASIGIVVAAYPLSWGVLQLPFGWLSDRIGRAGLIAGGMWVQALGHAAIGIGAPSAWVSGLGGAILLGIGTAMVYPTLLAAVSDGASAQRRPRALAVYRFWRDGGYVVGALGAGFIADRFGMVYAVHAAGALTALSGVIVALGIRRPGFPGP